MCVCVLRLRALVSAAASSYKKMLRKPCGGLSPAVDVSRHPNHFLCDRIMSPLLSRGRGPHDAQKHTLSGS